MEKFSTYIKNHHSGIAFWVCTATAIGLFIGSFFCPPCGQIDSSVLIAGSELLAFAALGILPSAIREGRSVKVKYQDAEIEVGAKDEK